MKKYLVLVLFTILLFTCKNNKYEVDISKIDLNLNLIRFDKDLFSISTDTAEIKKILPKFRQKYGSFFELYNQNIVNIGNSFSEMYPVYLHIFLTNKTVKTAWQKANAIFNNDTELRKGLTDAFKHFKYYFPNRLVPEIYTYISGFGDSMVLADSLVGISMEKYIGANDEVYDMLAIPRYMSRKMYKEKIPSDCVTAWAIGEFPLTDNGGNNLISRMIYEGKLLYFAKKMIPSQEDTITFGFTKEQLKWCKDNEKNMWAFLIEQKLLFSTDHVMLVKMTGDAPFSQLFPPESPGRACNWIGYHIVDKFMQRNSDISLAQLMEDNNHQRIFEKSKYKP
ncbi:MAG: hypothetical protein LBL90_10940 [Prevotellaceae bacterium]|jgi:hypothetical protein|nr:hypothetical protein [Prevotellaceae bacterium]